MGTYDMVDGSSNTVQYTFPSWAPRTAGDEDTVPALSFLVRSCETRSSFVVAMWSVVAE